MVPPDQDSSSRRREIAEEIRARLGLPDWSNLRGDDVIALILAQDEASRARLNDLFVQMREIDDDPATTH